ncbi:MAG: cytochrome o ubiquinol oxidase operon protein cyoD [Candidatus Deianiraeaceae bacterium]|jgi:cytochrome o ubiquinol oxidase operon protein cyoD
MIDSRITYKSYFVGLAISIALTLSSYFTIILKPFSVKGLYSVLAVLAVVQILVQIFYFLHIGHEDKPRWNLISLVFALLIIFIVVAGSLWVMYNLNTNMM